jgi:hypothetical protein
MSKTLIKQLNNFYCFSVGLSIQYWIRGFKFSIRKNKRILYTMSYKITPYTYARAKHIGVTVKPSTDKTKKIDVFRVVGKGKNKTMKKKIASIGAAGMMDYPSYMQKKGIKFAKTRRRLYKMRHERDRHIKWSRGWLANTLLW